MSLPDYKFLHDKPLKESEHFYHKEFAPALRNILENNSCLHTIGLFGKWGTGKSTIIRILRNQSDDSNFKVIEFDSWKYEQDYLRRQLLIKIANGLGLGKKYMNKLKNKFYSSIREPLKDKIHIHGKRLLLCLVIAFTLGIAFASATYNFHEQPFQFILAIFLFLSGGISTYGIVIPDDFKKIVTISPILATRNPLNSPELFEEEFRKIITNKKNKYASVIVVIDNLDRVDAEKVKEVLSTLKTFLEIKEEQLQNKKVIFVIPCDFEAVKKTYKDEGYADEFLKKIFNIGIWTPEFIVSDIEDFTENQLLKSEIGEISELLNKEDVRLVINSAFKNNPREIKQFINNLIATTIVALQTEVKDIIRKNIAYLAKVLFLKRRFPEAYENLKTHWHNPENIELPKEKPNEKEDESKEQKEFRNFMKNTGRVTTSNARPFIYFKKPAAQSGLPNPDKLLQSLTEANQEETKKIIEKYNDDQKKKLIRYIINLLNEYSIQTYYLLNIFSTHLKVFSELQLEISSKNYFQKLIDVLDRNLWERYKSIPIDILFEYVLKNPKTTTSAKNLILTRYISVLNTDEVKTDYKFLETLILNIAQSELLSLRQQLKIAQILEKDYPVDLQLMKIIDKIPEKESFITTAKLDQFINEIGTDKDFVGTADILLSFKDKILEKDLLNTLYQNVARIAQEQYSQHSTTKDEDKKIFMQAVASINAGFKKHFKDIDSEHFYSLIDTIINFSNTFEETENKSELAINLRWFTGFCDSQRKANIDSELDIFLAERNNTVAIKKFFNYWNQQTKQNIFSDYENTLLNTIINDDLLLPYFFEFSKDEQKLAILEHMTSYRRSELMNFIESQDKNKTLPERIKLIDFLLERAKSSSDEEEKEKIYDFIAHRLRKNDAVDLKEKAISQISTLIINNDGDLQKIALEFFQKSQFLTDENKRNIAKQVIELLRNPSTIVSIDFAFAIQLVTETFELLQDTLKKDYIFTLFDNLKEDKNVETLRLLIKAIQQLAPAYRDHQKDYDDLLQRLQDWDEQAAKKEVITGILQLKRKSRLKAEKEYWKQIESLENSLGNE